MVDKLERYLTRRIREMSAQGRTTEQIVQQLSAVASIAFTMRGFRELIDKVLK